MTHRLAPRKRSYEEPRAQKLERNQLLPRLRASHNLVTAPFSSALPGPPPGHAIVHEIHVPFELHVSQSVFVSFFVQSGLDKCY